MKPTIRSHSARTFSILYKAFRRETRDLREIYPAIDRSALRIVHRVCSISNCVHGRLTGNRKKKLSEKKTRG